jgi:hypothetical protein
MIYAEKGSPLEPCKREDEGSGGRLINHGFMNVAYLTIHMNWQRGKGGQS